MEQMPERRADKRLLCADLVEVIWYDSVGRQRRKMGNLEDISLCGMCIQLETPISAGTEIRVPYGDGELVGTVRYALCRDGAYFLGIELLESSRWSTSRFVPQHLLDPRELMQRTLNRRGSFNRNIQYVH
jgi:hypothetical protein